MSAPKPGERLFKYPPMERQDLNQTQLGSFKFTPVDPVNNFQALTNSAKQFLEHQLSSRQRTGHVSTSTGLSPDNSSTLSSQRPPANHAQPDVDPSFFNKHIKPDLDDSRLRLGPAALRSAVQGASPTKRASLPFQQSHGYPEARHDSSPPFQASLSRSRFRHDILMIKALPICHHQLNDFSLHFPSKPPQPRTWRLRSIV
jgi:hypothetical protein